MRRPLASSMSDTQPLRANRLTPGKRPPQREHWPVYRRLSALEVAISDAKGEIDATLRRFARKIEEREKERAA